jgi:hypothetical protein
MGRCTLTSNLVDGRGMPPLDGDRALHISFVTL